MTHKPEFCKNCPINAVTEGYIPLQIGSINELWVGEAADADGIENGKPFVGGSGRWLSSLCQATHISRSTPFIINTIGCKPPNGVYPTSRDFKEAAIKATSDAIPRIVKVYGPDSKQAKAAYTARSAAVNLSDRDGYDAVQYCYRHHLQPALQKRSWKKVLALGNEALKATTTRQGILTWRGSVLPFALTPNEPPKVVPIIHPGNLARQADLFSVTVRDLKRPLQLPPEHYKLYGTIEELRAFRAKKFAFDFEWDREGNITLCGVSDKFYTAIVFPWCDPYIDEFKRLFEEATDLIGHNIIGADTKFFEKLKWNVTATMHDTMLKQHLIQPDMAHSLAFTASVFTNKVHWKGKGEETEDADGNSVATGAQWKTWNHPDGIRREYGGYAGCTDDGEAYRLYNARDTDAEFQCNVALDPLLDRYGLTHTYWNVSVPVAFICRRLGETGIKLDSSGLDIIRAELTTKINELDAQLPEGLRSYTVPVTKQEPAPPGTYKPKTKICKGPKGAKHTPVHITFTEPGKQMCSECATWYEAGKMQELKRIKVSAYKTIIPWNSSQQVMKYAAAKGCKQVLNSKTGSYAADKNARKTWGRQHVEFATVNEVKKYVTIKNNFAKEALVGLDRIFFNLLVHGTAEGRLSSSGKRPGIDPNIQNQPEEIRKIYLPDDPSWCWLDSDVVQGENMLTAWLAKDWIRWERLNTRGFDEHTYMTMKFFNLREDEVTKTLRKAGKIVNHGRNYGLGVKKTVEYLAAQDVFFSEADVREMIEIWKKENARTAAWQNETIALAQRQSYLENPFQRRRWFQGRDFATKALAFLPASTLADMVLRMMIALHPNGLNGISGTPELFRTAISNLRLGVIGEIPEPWAMRIQVHDSLVFQGPYDLLQQTARTVHAVMTQRWQELDNFAFNVSMKASKPGGSWGSSKDYVL